MEKEFVTYEQALALKELGFDEERLCRWYEVDNLTVRITAPFKSQVFRWFREKYDLHHIVIWDSDTNNFDAGLFGELVTPFLEKDTIFSTYEEAENACIDKLIEIAKQQDNE